MTATAIQFLNGRQPIPAVSIIAGRNFPVRQYAFDTLISRLPKSEMYSMDFGDVSRVSIIEMLSTPSIAFASKTIALNNMNEKSHLDVLESFVQSPTPGIFLVLTADTLRREDGQRWIPSTSSVLYIDCGNITEESLLKFILYIGIPEEDSLWLIDYASADIETIIGVAELLETFPILTPGLVQKVCIREHSQSPLNMYSIIMTDISSIFRQMQRRIIQLISLSTAIAARSPIVEMARRADIEPFMAKRLLPLAKSLSPAEWFGKLALIERLGEYRNQPGVIKYLEMNMTDGKLAKLAERSRS